MDFTPLCDRPPSRSHLSAHLKASLVGDLFLLALMAYFFRRYGLGVQSLVVPLLAALRLRLGPLVGYGAVVVPLSMFYLQSYSWPKEHLTGCKTNLKQLATAMEMYSTDNAGRYPTSMKRLVPKYLDGIPKCPEAGNDTYSVGFQTATSPDAFTLTCKGLNHATVQVGENFPQYFNTSS